MSVGIPEATILARAQAFNKVQIAGYFNKLESVSDEFKFTPVEIHNVDKSAASVSNAQSGFAKVNAEIPENGEVTASADVSVNEEVSGLVEALYVETANIRSNHDKHASLSQIAKVFIEDLSPTPQVGTPVAKKRRMKKGSQGGKKSARKVKRRVELFADSHDENDPFNGLDSNDDCIYCNSLCSQSRSCESWIQCQNCRL
ncbi:hypothetical protein ILUMI_21445 [Ignelater luminosus]|uniref:Uncharacterized protein n=1 Tax=Ignelater luminosus TaxID=2038154 RepID=A0A8K0CEI7_IGNLU|nr:hypothetical protein ILUMI_21445 [Ignelater luminosus]